MKRMAHEYNRVRFSRKHGKAHIVLFSVFILSVFPAVVFSHHILGIPHYAYDEDYPQAPVLTYLVNAGPHEVRMTGYPGKPVPGELCSLHVYINRIDNGEPFAGQVTLTAMKDNLIGEDTVVYGPVAAEIDQSVFKFYPRFETEANFVVRIEFEAEGEPWTIDLPMVAGEPGSPWIVLSGVVGALAAFLIVIRAIRIKMKRRARETRDEEDGGIGSPEDVQP